MQNQKNDMQGRQLTLTIITPDIKPVTVLCDSVRIMLRDDLNGRGGGSYGIRRGHAEAVLALGKGEVTALSCGETVLCKQCGEGFVRVSNDTVTVITESMESEDK